ncbi:PREDICTED: probable polygalacturonase At3g15720 [Camelina sativa]|uniref:Probable polygalacturonase At3g15720 n=1 Tax=Camelina sativa TaxID=90675 RepID=A0ABM1QFX5_CAMSA|nr:PREDICTED: probable polygalacturonase At3g15720 [Camelina sativa]
MKYGAVGDGIADDTSAFQKAWENACKGSSKTGSVHVPAGKVFLLNSLHFTGPCIPKPLLFTIDGEMIAQSDPNKWENGENGVIPWLIFDQVDGLAIVGRGMLNGQGKAWWDIHCRDHPGPMMTFSNCGNVTLKSLRFRDSAQTHVLVMGSQNVYISDIKITSPEASPNTDGIHITSSTAVSISHSDIAAGDDCVSIGDQVNSVTVSFVNCGPGHGVSIGSLGRGGTEVAVENIRVSHVNFTGTTNGARIKTWPGGTGYVRGIEFFDIRFSSVQNPIIIDQFYGCSPNCPQTSKGVHIDKVRYMKMSGTSATKVAMKLDCSGLTVPCSNLFMRDIDLSPADGIDSVSSLCSFVQGSAKGIIRPSSCL